MKISHEKNYQHHCQSLIIMGSESLGHLPASSSLQRVALTLNLVSSEPCKGQDNSIANESTRARGTSSPAEERNHVARALDPPKSRR